MTLIHPIKFDDDKSKAPASFLFSLGLWPISSLFISIQLLPPATRVRLSEIVGAIVAPIAGAPIAEIMVIDTLFLRLHFVILLCFLIMLMFAKAPSTETSTLVHRFRLAFAAESEHRTEFLVRRDADNLIQGEDKVS